MSSSPANTGNGGTSPTAVPDVESGISRTSDVNKNDDLHLTTNKNSTKSPSLLQSILPINTTPAVYIPPDYSFEDRASPLSRIFLLYLDPLFKLGTTRNLNHEDLGIAAAQDKSVQLFETFSHHWRNELNKAPEKRSLWMVLWRTTGWTRVCNSVLLYAISAGISYGPILILNQLVLYFQGGINLSAATLWIYVALMFILPMSASIFMAQSNIIVAHIGIQFRNCLVNMIYRKALKLSPASRQQQSTGMIVNMFSNDTKQIQSFLFFFNNCLIAPFQIIVCLILIYLQVGPATFVGLGIMFCVIPFNFYIFMMLNRIRLKKVKKTDIRVKLMNEILSGIRVIKFYAWESAFEKNILAVRKEELILLKQMAYIVAFGFTLVLMAVPLVQPILVFYTYVQLGNQLTAATAFTTIALFNMLQFPFAFLPLGLSQYSQSLVSTKRMLNFFVSDELDGYVTNHVRDDNVVIAAQNLSVCWIKDPPPPVVSSAAVSADGTGGNGGLISKSVSQVSLNTAANANSSNTTETNSDKQQSQSLMVSSDIKSIKNVQFTDDDDHNNDNNDNIKKKEYNAVPNNDSTDNGDDHHQLVDIEATTGNNAETNASVNDTIVKTTSDDADGVASSKSVISPSVVSSNNNNNRSYNTLVDMNLRIEKGSLVAVVGNVGSGKSSFLSALLGEMHCQSGSINVTGSVAYCEQRPWILNATVEQNILFGEPMNQKRFDAAMHAACLEEDIKVLPGGIHTEIGERGINLSGGQKARVALARAVYKKADLYLLDDPLSAVDAHVGQHIFKHCIKNTLKGSTRILVTHQVHLLNQCDLIIVLDDGKIKAQGSYEDLQKSGVDISNYIPFYDSDEESQGELTEYTTEGSVSGSDSDEDDNEEEEKDKVRKNELKQNTIANSNSNSTKESDCAADSNSNDHVHHNNNSKTSNIQAVNESWKLSTASTTRTNVAVSSTPVTMDDVTLEETKQEAVASNNNSGSHDITTAAGPAVDGDKSTISSSSGTDEVAILSDEDKAKADADERHLDTRGVTNIMSIEERIMGDVSANVYSYYIRAGGIFLFLIVIACLLATQATQLIAQFFLASWGDKTANAVENGGDGLSTSENIQQLNTYAWLSMLPLVFMVMRAVGLADHRLGTSVKLHQDCLHRILGAPTAFFDVTPLGRILNRFSSDMLTIDEELSQTISQLSNSVFQCLGAIAAVAGATKGTFLVLMAPLAVFYFQVQKLFRKTNTTIARLESISRSPIYTDFSQALVGAISIRAYKDESRFITKLEQCIDNNSVAAVTSALCSQWLAMRLDFVGACITFFIALIAVATNGNFIPAGYLALGLTNAFQVTTYLKFAVRMIATAEAQMNSVERIKLYAEQVPQEELDESNNNSGSSGTEDNNANKRNGSLSMSKNNNNDKSKDKSKATSSEPTALTTPTAIQDIPADWPNHGEIKVQDIQMAYRDGPLVLKGVSFNVRGGMKVGIAGRTGSGKSSLMIALFRIQELSAGSITIDGIDTAKIPLRVLRSKLGIIPQDPVMFSATVRFNLDPFNEHTDLEIWNILESVDMKNHIVTMEKGLNEEVAEGGDNFSAGQRQLICIARALLRQPKILVLDEATASIDNETDALIQRTIRNSFKDCTVLTIAHRLHTIIDSDRIIVLDNGKLAEIGPPVELLEKPLTDGLFRSLWEKHQASHLEGDYPAYPLADEITLKRTVVRSESSIRAGAFKRTKSSHRSHSNRQFPRNSSAESHGSSGSSDGDSAKKSSRKKSNRALVEMNTHNSMRDSSMMMSIPETADEKNTTTTGGGGATPKTPSNTK